MSANRELRAEIVIDAPVPAVWSVLADPARMPELSPELIALRAVKPGGLRVGQWYVGVNRRGFAVWPTRSVVAELVPERRLAWDTVSSGARWIWELQPEGPDRTKVLHRRPVPRRLTWMSAAFAGALLGGAQGHADELEQDMATSAARLKRIVEA